MTPTPINLPVHQGGILERLLADWEASDWDARALDRFHMGPDPDPDDPDPDDPDPDDPDPKADKDDRVRKANDEAARHRIALKPWKKLADELGVTPDEVRAALAKKPKADKDDPDPDDKIDPDKLRSDIERETTAKANKRIVRSEIKALASDLFADPADAPLYLDIEDYEVDDDGEVDEEKIRLDLKAVLKRKPHLAKGESDDDEGRRRGPKPDRAQGARGGDDKSSVSRGRQMFDDRRGKAKPKTDD